MKSAVFESFSASLFTPASRTPGLQSVHAVRRHAKGWVALTRARNERCDKAKQVAVNCRKPPAKPFQTWLLSGQSHGLRVPARELCKKEKKKKKSWTHLVERQWIVAAYRFWRIASSFFKPYFSLRYNESNRFCTCRLNMLLTKQLVARFEGRFIRKWSLNQVLICSELHRKVFRRDTTNLPKELLIGNLHRDVKGAF